MRSALIQVSAAHPLATRPAVTGRPAIWARDLAIVGGGTSLLVPAMLSGFTPAGYTFAAAIAGTVTGALLGLLMPTLLELVRGRVPIALLLMCGPVLGAAWGATAAVLASAATDPSTMHLAVISGGVAGAVQFGWLWFPYTFQTVRGARRWPLVVLAVASFPGLAAITFMGTMLTLGTLTFLMV